MKSARKTNLCLLTVMLALLSFPVSAQKKATAENDALMKKGESHFFNGRYRIALKIMKMIVANDPENAAAYSYLGDIYLMMGQPVKAEENIRIAIELSGRPDREYYRLGQALYLKKDAQGAIAAFEKAMQLNPRLYICRFQIGLVYLNLLLNKEKTIEYWSAFREISPDDPQGPAIDRALEILKRKDFKQTKDKIKLPKGADSRIPYKKADPSKEKQDNKKGDVIDIDDL